MASSQACNLLRPNKLSGDLTDGCVNNSVFLWINFLIVCNRVYCVHSGPWPFNLLLSCPLSSSFFFSFFFFSSLGGGGGDWVAVLWPHLSKVLKLVRWDRRVLIVQELCESRGGRPGLSVLTSLLVSVDVKNYWTVLRHWSQLVPNMSADIWGH